MQTHARDDDELVQKLVSIRKLLTPSANWIQDDRNAERDEERRRELDMQMIEQKNEEARRKEVATQEEAKQERLRAKKIALGLNPAVVRPPVLVDKPPPLVVAVKNSHVELRVNANFAQKFQWFFNSHPIETETFVSGINRCALVIAKLTKRVMGEYFCICENEEGTVTSPTCLVLLTALKVSRLVSTPLETLSKSPMYSCETNMMLTAIGNSIHLYDAKSLDTITALPALPMAIKTLAWDPQTKLLTAFSASIPQKNMTAATQILFYSPKRHTAGFSKSDFPTTFSRQRNNNKRGPAIKPQMPSRGNSLQFQLMDVQSVDTLTEVCAAEFLDSGKRLLLTDMKHQVALYDFSPLFEWKQTISFDSDVICHVTASPRSPALFALAFRNKPFVKLFSSTTDDKTRYRSLSEHRVAFKFPAHRTSFDALGHFLAVAETGFMKSWISIVNVNTKRSSKRRFIAHAGNISGLQWTTSTSLLLSSSHDGYVKVWDPVAMSNLLSIHIDKHGIHSMLLMEELALLLVLGHSGRRLQSQQVLQLPQLEASRLVEMNRQAANVQKRVKGRKTREFLATVIKNSR